MWTRLSRIAIPVGIFVGTLLFRLATFSVTNDDYLHLSLAQQVLLGDVPVRDFIDPGEFLFYYLSAAAQLLLGRNLLSEVILDVVFLSIGHTLVFLLAFRATRSRACAVLVTTIAVLLVPRLYSYPKIFLYPLALVMIWQYADDPRQRRVLWIALFTAIAFLFRHDHGTYIGAAMCAMLLMTHWEQGWPTAARRLLLYGASTAALLLPFFLFLQVNGGVITYWRNTIETGRAEYRRTVGAFPVFRVAFAGVIPIPAPAASRIAVRWVEGTDERTRRALEQRFRLTAAGDQGEGTWEYDLNDRSSENIASIVGDPHVADTHGIDRAAFSATSRVQDPNVVAWFYYLTILLPAVTILVIAGDVRGGPANHLRQGYGGQEAGHYVPLMTHEVQKIVTVAVLAVLMHVYLLRSASDVAIADVSSITAVVGAWLLARGLRRGGPRGWLILRATCTLAVLGITLAAAKHAEGSYLLGQLAGAPQDGDRVPLLEKLAQHQQATAPFDDDGARYVFDCTDERDRLLVTTEYAPHLYYRAGRGFAAGRVYFLKSLAPSPSFESFSLDRLRVERVPIVLVSDADYVQFSSAFARIHEYLLDHYREAGEIEFEGVRFRVLADERIPPLGIYGPRSLPCFRSSGRRAAR